MERLMHRWSVAMVVCAAVVLGAGPQVRGGELLQAAAKAKKTGLPLFVMFSSPSCKYCREMKQRLKTEPELTKMITTQYVFVETDTGDAEAKQFIEHYKVNVSGVPHTCIVSAQGEMVAESGGLPQGDGLNKLLLKGIEKTGGLKNIASQETKNTGPITKLEGEELTAVLKQVAEAKDKIASEDTALEGIVELLAVNRVYVRVAEVKKETGPIFAEVNKNKTQKELLVQARMLDSAAAAIEAKNEKLAEGRYQLVIKKYPDSAAAKYAQAKLDAMAETPTSAEDDAAVAQKNDESAAK